MNKTLLFILLASSLSLVACSKPDSSEDSLQDTSNPASEPLQPLGASSVTAVDIDREQTANTTTEIRREYYDFQQKQAAEQAANDAGIADNGSRVGNVGDTQTEDDAVAAAIAAATPAISSNSIPKAVPAQQPQSESAPQQQ